MSEWLIERWQVLKSIFDRRWFKRSTAILSAIGAYDLLGAQLLPKWIAERLPPVREVVGMTSGWLPWWAWGWIGTALLAGAAVEYAVRLHRATKTAHSRQPQSPFAISLDRMYPDVLGNEFVFNTPLTVHNSSPVLSFDGVEVHLISVSQMQPKRGGTQLVRNRLIERISHLPTFSLTPSMQRDVFFLRPMHNKEEGPRFKLGPIERPNGQQLSYGPGLYKIDIAVYGRDARPAIESLAIGLDESGALMHAQWRDDLPWPFTGDVVAT